MNGDIDNSGWFVALGEVLGIIGYVVGFLLWEWSQRRKESRAK